MSKEKWLAVVLGCLIGLTVGIGGYTFVYAKGYSYMTNDPAACANCHVMQGQLDGWQKSSHHSIAACNDCHTPHNFVGKYYTKARNGFWHSFYFTSQTFHEPIEISSQQRHVVEENCRRCHGTMVESIEHGQINGETISCVRCHNSVGHLEQGCNSTHLHINDALLKAHRISSVKTEGSR
jgi:cytochrome c nitrite reductase small subunit